MTMKIMEWKLWIIILTTAVMAMPAAIGSAAITGYAAHGKYGGFAEPVAGYTLSAGDFVFSNASDANPMAVTADDFAVYRYVYASLNGSPWQRFELTGRVLGGDWLNGSVSAGITLNASDFGLSQSRLSTQRNYVVLYSCSRTGGVWDCHGGWQIWQFNASLEEEVTNLEISDLAAQSGSAYEVSYYGLAEGEAIYTDRSFVFTDVPEAFAGMTYIKTANNDKTETQDPYITFDINIPATVYVAVDVRASPSWLSSWTEEGTMISTDDTDFDIYSKRFSEGQVAIGGNGCVACSMYSIIVDGGECEADCTGKECGPDGCGGTCEPGCGGSDTCDGGTCIPCQPACGGKECGDDGCGGHCPPGCTEPQTCTGGDEIQQLRVSDNGRFLVKEDGTPFFMNGDTAWSLIAEVSRTDADYYLQSRADSGFNTILANLIESKYSSNAPADYYGDAPFTGKAFTTPNEAYFAHADYVVASAKDKGLIVLLGPLYLDTDEGWGDEVMAASESDMLYWGQYVGNRYKDYGNIIWVIGGDINPSFADAKAMKVVEGIRQYNPDALFTAHTTNEKMAVDYWSDTSWLNVNDIYSYGNGVPGVASTAYHYSPTKPFFMFESVYENEYLATGVQLRSQAYWTVLSGAFGNVFGNCPMWNFDATTAAHYCGSADWKGLLDTEGTRSMGHFRNLFESRSWQLLVPDFSHSVLKSGYGTMGEPNYATAARTSDGSTIIAYIPTQRTVTVDTTVLGGSSVRAWWYNPRDGTSLDLGTMAEDTSQSFSAPTSSGPDWVLVLDDASAGYGPPGT